MAKFEIKVKMQPNTRIAHVKALFVVLLYKQEPSRSFKGQQL